MDDGLVQWRELSQRLVLPLALAIRQSGVAGDNHARDRLVDHRPMCWTSSLCNMLSGKRHVDRTLQQLSSVRLVTSV